MHDNCDDECPLDRIEAILENKRLGSNRFVLVSVRDLYRLHELTTFVLSEEEGVQALQDCKRIWSVIAQIRIPRKDTVFLPKYVSLLLDVAGFLGLHLENNDAGEEYRRHMWETLETTFEKVFLLAQRFWLIGNEPIFMRIIFSVATIYSLFKDVATENVICKCYELSCEAMLIGDMSLTESEWRETTEYCENIENMFVLRRRMEDNDEERGAEVAEDDEDHDGLYHHHEGDNYEFTQLCDPLEEEMYIEWLVRDALNDSVLTACHRLEAADVVAEALSVKIMTEALNMGHHATIDHFYDNLLSEDEEEDEFYESCSSSSESEAEIVNHDDLYHHEPVHHHHHHHKHSVYDAKSDFEKRFGMKRLKDSVREVPVIVNKPENFVTEYRRQPLFNFTRSPKRGADLISVFPGRAICRQRCREFRQFVWSR